MPNSSDSRSVRLGLFFKREKNTHVEQYINGRIAPSSSSWEARWHWRIHMHWCMLPSSYSLLSLIPRSTHHPCQHCHANDPFMQVGGAKKPSRKLQTRIKHISFERRHLDLRCVKPHLQSTWGILCGLGSGSTCLGPHLAIVSRKGAIDTKFLRTLIGPYD